MHSLLTARVSRRSSCGELFSRTLATVEGDKNAVLISITQFSRGGGGDQLEERLQVLLLHSVWQVAEQEFVRVGGFGFGRNVQTHSHRFVGNFVRSPGDPGCVWKQQTDKPTCMCRNTSSFVVLIPLPCPWPCYYD